MAFQRTQSAPLAVMAALWVAGSGAGLCWLAVYSFLPGALVTPAAVWPEDLPFQRSPDLLTLVMTVHPQCACTRASLDELAVIRARTAGRLELYVLFTQIDGVDLHSALWRQAAAIPGVVLVADPGGRMAERFGAATSGRVLVFAPDGERLFSGGITASRGHAGSNFGRAAILELAADPGARPASTPAFGCALAAHAAVDTR